MAIVGAFDVHRRQITFDYTDMDSGQVWRGRIVGCREMLQSWLARFAECDDVVFAVEACTGWRFVTEELQRAGIEVLLAEPAETAAARGRKQRAKTDRTDARHMRQLLIEHRLPLSWMPPEQVLEMRGVLELFKDLRQDHTAWVQRVQAVLFHHGVAAGKLDDPATRQRLQAGIGLSAAGHQAVLTGLRVLDGLDAELVGLRRQITAFARRQPGCAALQQQFGVGAVTATAIWSQFGDTRRFSASRKAVRHTGLDVTVYSSDGKRSPGHLSRQGSPLLRWALFEAGKCAARPASPDYAYYTQVKQRCGGNRAALSVARKIA